MTQLCFGTFAAAIQRALCEDVAWWNKHIGLRQNRNKTFLTQNIAGQCYTVVRLLTWITDMPDVLDRNGQPIYISDDVASTLMNQTSELNAAIVHRIQRGDLDKQATSEFTAIVDELIKYKVNDLLCEVHDLICNDPQVSKGQQQDLLRFCRKEDLARFLADTFLYACCLKNKLAYSDLSSNDGWLIHVSDNLCPICHENMLSYGYGTGTKIFYDAVEFPIEPGSAENARLLVCTKCFRKTDFHYTVDGSEPEIFEDLRKSYRECLLKQEIEAAFEKKNLPSQIAEVIEALVSRPSDEQLNSCKPDDWEAKAVQRKIRKENGILASQIKLLADTYYFYLQSVFASLDNGSTRRFRKIRDQVSACYSDLADLTEDQIEIFTQIRHWIARCAGVSENSSEALVIAAFFVQNCEVFDEISE